MASDAGDQPTFARSVAYSTGLSLGRMFVQIVADWIGAQLRKRNRMSTAKADLRLALQEITEPTAKAEVNRVLDELPEAFTLDVLVEHLDEREQIRQGLWSALNEPLVSQEEMEAWFDEWARETPATSTGNTQVGDEAGESLYEYSEEQDADAPSDREVRITRDEVREVLNGLPDDCTLKDILYTLYVREQITQGIWSLENEPTYTQEEVEQSLSRWLTD